MIRTTNLVVSELVTESILHAQTVVDLALSHAQTWIRVAVHDRGDRAPRRGALMFREYRAMRIGEVSAAIQRHKRHKRHKPVLRQRIAAHVGRSGDTRQRP